MFEDHGEVQIDSDNNETENEEHLELVKRACIEGRPGVFGEQGNIGKISKETREHKPIFREQGNKTLQLRGRKH